MKKKNALLNTLVVLIAILFSLLAAELLLRVIPAEKNAEQLLDYRDSWRQGGLGPGGYLQEDFTADMQDGFGGAIRWKNNSQGFRNDKDFLVPPPANTFRILSMGDSFTGGYRVGQDETFSFLIEQQLAEKYVDLNPEVMISVIEDPLTGLYYLASQGASYSPDLVVLGITLGNDIAQTYWNMGPIYRLIDSEPFVEEVTDRDASKKRRAGIEAEQIPSKCLTPRGLNQNYNKSGPRWSDKSPQKRKDELRIISLLSNIRQRFNHDAPQTVISNWEEYDAPRLFDSNGLGIFLRSPPAEVTRAYDELFMTLSAYSKFSRSRKLEFLVVIFPQRFQVQDQDWSMTLDVYGLREACFDRELPGRRIMDFCKANKINCFDPAQRMKELYETGGEGLYLPRHDMHWNARGHSALADALLPVINGILKQ